MKSIDVVAGDLMTIEDRNDLRDDARLSAMLQITANPTPDSNVNLQEGYFTNSLGVQVDISAESITNLTFPSVGGESWYILVSIDNSGTVTRTYGASASSPTKPLIPALHFALAYVLLAQGGSVINDGDIEDVRSSLKTTSPIEVISASLDYMLGDTGIVGKAYSLIDYEQTTLGADNDFGSIAQPKISQSFYAQDIDIIDIKLMIKTIASPSDTILLEIQTDNAGVPSDTVVTNGTSDTIDYTALSGTSNEETFTFSSIPELTTETLYHIVLKRSGATDAVNYYSTESAGSDIVLGTMSKDTGSWTNATDDLYFKLTTGHKIATLGGTNFIGILQETGTVGEIKKFNTGYDNNQSGLTPNEYYGYNVTTGAIELGGDFRALSEIDIFFDTSYNNPTIQTLIAGENLTIRNTVYINTTDGKAYKTVGTDSTKFKLFGIVMKTVSTGGIAIIYKTGIIGGFSGLILGDKYYVGSFTSGSSLAYLSGTSTFNIGSDTNSGSIGQQLTAGQYGIVVTSASFKIRKFGAPTGTLSAYIYSDDLVLLGTSTNSYSDGDLTTVGVEHSFTFNNTYVPGGTYRVLLKNTVVNASNYYKLNYHSLSSGSGGYERYNTSMVLQSSNDDDCYVRVYWKYYTGSGINNFAGPTGVGQAIDTTNLELNIDDSKDINGPTGTSATSGGLVPPNVAEYLSVNVNGNPRKIALYY